MLRPIQRHAMIFANDAKTLKTEYSIKNVRKFAKRNLSDNFYGNSVMESN